MASYHIMTPKELLAMTLAATKKAPATSTPTTAVKPTNTPLVNPTAAQQLIINQQLAASQKAGYVAPVVFNPDLPGGGGSYDQAMLASIFGTGGAAAAPATAPVYTTPTAAPAYTAPAYTAPAYAPVNVPPAAYTAPDMTAPAYTNPTGGPLMDAANAAFAEYQKSATGAANNALDAQMAQANSVINGGGIWATLQPIADKQMQDSITALGQISALAKGNVEASRTALNVQEAAAYDTVIKDIDTSIVAARHRTNEEMNQRGMFFSTVLDAAMGTVEASGTTQKGQASQQNKASLAKIAADMAVMSANIDIETIKGNASAVAQYTASMLQVVAQDAQTKQTAQALLASLNAQKAGVVDAVAAQVFATGQQLKATAFGQQSQLNTDASNAAITKYNQQVQQNLDAANAQATAFNQAGQLSEMAFNQQVQRNNDAANAAITKFSQQEQVKLDAANAANADFSQQAQLRGEATNAANTLFDQNRATAADTANATTAAQQEFVNTMGRYANDYRAAANALDPNDPLYAFKEGMLESAHNQKAQTLTAAQAAAVLQQAKDKAAAAQQTFDNILSAAKVDISSATQQATAAYQSGQLNISQYNAATSRMNADTSRYNATKPAAGASSTGGLTYAQAMGNIDDYTKLQTTRGALTQGTDGKWYEKVPNPNWVPGSKTITPYLDMPVDVTTLDQQIAELEPAYRASIAVRDKTSGTTTPLPLDATETANVEGFFTKVNSKANEMYGSSTAQAADKAAYKHDYAQAFLKQYGALYNEKEEKAILARYNSGG